MCVSSYTYTQTHTQFVSSFHYFCMSWNFQTIIKFRKSSFKQHRIHPIHSSSSITNLPINSLYQKTVINNLCSLANFISHYVIWLARILAARTIKWTPVVEDLLERRWWLREWTDLGSNSGSASFFLGSFLKSVPQFPYLKN